MESANDKKVLIVDDDPDVLFVIGTALESEGYVCKEAQDGLDAIQKIYLDLPDVIILDFMMPKLDGHSVTIKLKEDPRTAKIPIVIITGKGNIKELLEIREDFKVAAYLEKPFRVSTLLEIMENLFSNKKVPTIENG
ncbi:hypothetical protein BVX98_01580 [bacterium F11]|nr:hypothetical protein BVX98_01580 [bacterium F11]